MSGQENNYVSAIPMTTFNPATLTGSFQAINSTGTADDVKILKMFNGSTTVGIVISFDGVTAHDYWPPQATLIIDFEANHFSINGSGTKYIRKGQVIYGATIAAVPGATQNFVFISGFR